MTLHISLVGATDLNVEIYRQARDAIVRGVLRPGERLPPSRQLAIDLAVSRMTVTTAYERLAAEGFVVSRIGDGTFVSPDVGRAQTGAKARQVEGMLRPRRLWNSIPLPGAFACSAGFDFRTGIPDASLFPHASWQRLLMRTLRDARSTRGLYDDPAGHKDLREAVARHVSVSRGLLLTADDVIVTSGTQQAADVIARTLFAPGDRIAVEDPGYWPVRRAFEALGIGIVGVPVDREGLLVQALPRNVRAVYVTPSHQYPLGVSMTLARRQALLAWADRQDAAVLEDDYDSEFRFGERPVDPLRTLDLAGRVIYIGSFSKTLLPSLRLGFIVAPRSLQSALTKARFLVDWHSPTLTQVALARFIETGEFGRHLRRVNAIYRERHQLLIELLTQEFADELQLIPCTTGLHVAALAQTQSAARIDAVAREAMEVGVAVQTLAMHAVGESKRAGLMFGYGGISTDKIQPGLRLLRKCFHAAALPTMRDRTAVNARARLVHP
jgi:GntR family transcriptional regulator / MocR family aminotransferase